jgi:PAS domain S-box-containing protein
VNASFAPDEVRTVLGCARRATGARTALFVPLVPGPQAQAAGPYDGDLREVLSPEDRALLRSGGRLWERPSRDAAGRAVAPVLGLGGATFGALGVLLDRASDTAEYPDILLDLAGLLGHAMAAEAERAEEGEFSRFFSLSLDNLCIAGFDGYFKLLNPRWEETLGYTLEELYARPYLEFVHPEDRAVTNDEKDSLNRGVRTITFSNRYYRKDGSLCYLQWTAAPSFERKRVYAVARDVTSEVLTAQELRQSRAAAEAASQAKSAFLAMMSHELRTPLNSVIGFSNLLLKNRTKNLSPEELNYAERIRSNGLDLLALINSILDLSRIEAGRVQPEIGDVDLASLATDLVESVRSQARPGVELSAEVPPYPVPYRTDEGRLRQILLNLLGNGLKFTGSGAVTLRLLCDADDRAPLAFEVRDTGPGIAAEHLETIFEPFRQLEDGSARRHDGSGLGLAISRSFAHALGLSIEVESRVGAGTVFRVPLRSDLLG